MSFEIKKIYTDNPYVDEMVYYTKQMGIGTVLKMQDQADNNETAASIKNADLYIACMENTVIFEILPTVSVTALKSAGIITPDLVKKCIADKYEIPVDKRAAVTKAMQTEIINNYEELNPYYRMLHGLPPIGHEDYVEDWLPPDGVNVDISKPIHLMDEVESVLLERYGVLDDMIAKDPKNRQYMRYLGLKRIDYYTARKANRFDALYIPEIDSDAIYKMYKDKLDSNKFYILRTVYSEAFKYGSDYYDNFIAVLIVITTIIDIISRVQEFITKKEIFDIRSVQYIFKSNGVPFYEEIPLKYQIAMVKNLHTLLKYKSTKKCMVDICSLFGFNNIKIFKYYLLRDRRVNLTTGEYIYATDENGEEDLEAEYELKFLKLPLEDDIDDYIGIPSNYIGYDEIVDGDPSWDGGLDHNMVMQNILKEVFNVARTKYMSIDTLYDITKTSMQQTYFFNFLYDDTDLESLLTVQVPFIEANRSFKLSDLFTLLTVLSYYYREVKDTIMDTQSKVLYINGFNFKADLAALAQDIANKKKTSTTIPTPGSIEHAQEQLENFTIPVTTIPSMNEMVDIYINNMEVRDELIKGMQEADNKEIYDIYKKLYDSLMTVQLTNEFYKNPETGDFYRDAEGDATYTEYLKNRDNSLYGVILEIEGFGDQASKNQYIANIIDNIVWALEEYIDTDEFQGIFSNLPAVSTEYVKNYIATIISFYKSYKVDFLGINTIYTLDDKFNGLIKLRDTMLFDRFFQKSEFITLYNKFDKMLTTIHPNDRAKLIERLYLDITYWTQIYDRVDIPFNDIIHEIWYFYYHNIILLPMEDGFHRFNVTESATENIHLYNHPILNIKFTPKDSLGISDNVWLNVFDDTQGILVADEQGYPVVGARIKTLIADSTSVPHDEKAVVTERAVYDYMDKKALMKDDIITAENVSDSIDESSDRKVISEKMFIDSSTVNVVEDE